MAIQFFNNPKVRDNVKIEIGDSSDLQIYHDGSNSYIKDSGAGNLVINAGSFVLNNAADTQNMIIGNDGGSVALYNAGTKRLETTSSGVSVTGDLLLEEANTPTLTLEDTTNNLVARFRAANSYAYITVDHADTVGSSRLVFQVDTTTPLYLDHQSNAVFEATVIVNGNGIDIDNDDDVRLRFDNAGTFKAGLQVPTTAGDMISGSAVNDFAIRSQGNMLFASGGNTERLRLDTLGNATFAGDVKATRFQGSTYPSNSILGSTTDATTTTIVAGSTANLVTSIDLAGSGATNPKTIIFKTLSAERMRIDSDGNVGIGVTAPDNKLQVDGAVHITSALSNPTQNISGLILDYSGGNSRFFARGTATNTKGTFQFFSISSTNSGQTTQATIKTDGQLQLNQYGSSGFTGTAAFNLSVDSSGNVIQTANPGGSTGTVTGSGTATRVAFWVNNNSGGVSTELSSDSALYWDNTNDRLGVGTNTPDAKLDIQGDGADFFLQSADHKIARIQPRGTGVNLDKGLFSLFSTTTESVRIDTAGDSWFNGGDVGIGTTAPNAPLDVISSSSSSSGIQQWSYNSNPTLYRLQLNQIVSSGLVKYSFDQLNAGVAYNNVLVLDRGKVGIGTTSPSYKLTVNDSTANGRGIQVVQSATSGTNYGIQGGAYGSGATKNIGLSITAEGATTNDAAHFMGGNVGIGTTSPNFKTHLYDSGNTVLGITAGVNNYAALQFGRTSDTTRGAIEFYTGDDSLRLKTGNNAEKMRIDSAGNVGIGTTAPGEKLEVVGNSITRSKTRGIGTNYATPEGWFESSAVASATGFFGGNFSSNGGSSENKIEYDIGPFGSRELVWMSIPETGNNDDGGWNKGMDGFSNSSNNGFMSVVYVRRDSGTPSGTFYHGCSQVATENLNQSANTNPYFSVLGIASLPTDVWCVAIGIIYANNDSTTVTSNLGGIYRLDTGQKINAATTYRQKASNATQVQRVYHYYSTSPTAQLDFAKPGFYIVDGSEPSLSELLNGGATDDAFWSASGNDIYNDNSGNVGIGTATPDAKLDIEKPAAGTTFVPYLQLSQTDTASNTKYGILFKNTQYGWDQGRISVERQSSASNFDLILSSSSAGSLVEGIRIDHSGNVGIGTTAPGAKLSVSGIGTSVAPTLSLTNTSSGNFNHSINAFAPNLTTGESNILVFGRAGSTKNSAYVGYRYSGTVGSNDNLLILGHWGSDNLMTITGDGKVGIGTGTTSPASKLHIYQNSTDTNTGAGITIEQDGTGDAVVQYLLTGDRRWVVGVDNSDSDRFKISSSADVGTNTVLTINTSEAGGKVGIGTTSPSQKLHVAGKGLFNNGDIGSNLNDTKYHLEVAGGRHHLDFMEVRTAQGVTDWKDTTYKLQMRVDSTNHQSINFVSDASYNEHLDIYTGNQVFNTRFNANGNVGIGTASPGAKLEVFGTGNTLRLDSAANGSKEILFRNVGTGTATIKTDGDLKLYAEDAGKNILFDTTGGEKMRITSGGNVGIGTDSPRNDANFITLQVGNTTTAASQIVLDDNDSNGPWRIISNQSLIINDNASERMRINLAGNVGIGTTNPTAKLTVVDNSNILSFSEHGSSAVAELKIIGAQAHDTAIYFGDSVDNVRAGFYYDVSSNQLQVRGYNNSTKIAVTSAGKVGIGTTNPGGTLDVDAPSTTANSLTFGAAAGQIFTNENSEFAFGLSNASPYPLYIQGRTNTNTARNITLQGLGGNIGIGTYSPNEKLDVAGKIYVEGNGQNWNETTPGPTRGSIHFDPGVSTNNAGNAITFGASDTSVGTNAQAGIYTRSDGTYGTKMYFATTDSYAAGSKTAMMINQNGNVGIGIIPPTEKLDVAGNIHLSANQAYISFNTSASSGHPKIRMESDGDFSFLNTAGASSMIIENGGDVGIGTTNPQAKLDVQGQIRSTSNIVSNSGYDAFYIGSSRTIDDYGGLYKNYFTMKLQTPSGAHAYGDLRFQLANSTSTTAEIDVMTLSYTGKVGIGTTSPNVELHISGAGSPGIKIQDSDGTNQFLLLEHNNGSSTYVSQNNTSNGSHVFYGSTAGNVPTERMRIDSSGNVGIGTTAPQKVLDVAVSADSVATVGASLMAVGKYAGIHFGYRENNTSYRKSAIVFERTDLLTGNAQGKVHILNGPQAGNGSATLADSKLTINEYGNVGIGVTAPASKLQVAGSVLISTTSGTPATGTNGLIIDHAAVIGGGTNSRFYSRGDATDRGGFQFNQLKNDNTGSRAVLTIDKDATATFAGDLMPAAENLYDIGSASVRWEDIFADQVYGRDFYVDTKIIHNGDTNNYKQFGTDTQIFVTAGVEKMRITSGLSNAGFVGIGATSPGTVNGTAFGGVLLHTKGSGNIGRLVLEGVVQGTMLMNASGSTANKRLKFMQAKSVNGASGGDAEFRMGKVTDSGTETTQVSIPDNGDMVIETAGQGLVLTSANGTQFRVTVSNSGQLGTTQI